MRTARTGAALLTALGVLWLLESTLLPVLGSAEPVAAPEQRIRISIARSEPPARPEPPQARAPAPETAEPRPPRAAAAQRDEPADAQPPASSEAELTRGRAWLDAGGFPLLRATYGRIGFAAYRDAVLDLGGRFFLFDSARRQPVAELDPHSGTTHPMESTADLSQWPRDVTRHLRASLSKGQLRFGPRVSRVILLPPAGVDAALLGALAAHLAELGVPAADLLRVDLAYELRDGRLECEVLGLSLRGVGPREVRLRIDLAAGVSA